MQLFHNYLKYLTIISIISQLFQIMLRIACASQWTRRPGAEEGGNQDIASVSAKRDIERLLEGNGAEPTPRGGRGGGVGIAIYVQDYVRSMRDK